MKRDNTTASPFLVQNNNRILSIILVQKKTKTKQNKLTENRLTNASWITVISSFAHLTATKWFPHFFFSPTPPPDLHRTSHIQEFGHLGKLENQPLDFSWRVTVRIRQNFRYGPCLVSIHTHNKNTFKFTDNESSMLSKITSSCEEH